MIQHQIQKRRSRGNPRWSQGKELEVPNVPSAFERMLKRLGLKLENDCQTLVANPRVEAWVRGHYRTKFVPEGLLKLLRLDWTLPGETAGEP